MTVFESVVLFTAAGNKAESQNHSSKRAGVEAPSAFRSSRWSEDAAKLPQVLSQRRDALYPGKLDPFFIWHFHRYHLFILHFVALRYCCIYFFSFFPTQMNQNSLWIVTKLQSFMPSDMFKTQKPHIALQTEHKGLSQWTNQNRRRLRHPRKKTKVQTHRT